MEKNLNGNVAEIVNLLNDARTRSSKEGKYSINVKYGEYSIQVANGDGFWVLRVYDDNVQEVIPEDPNIWKFLWGKTRSKDITGRDYGICLGRRWCGSLVERAAEEAIKIINKYEDDLDWENLMDEGQKITDRTSEFENKTEDLAAQIDSYMDETEKLMDEVDENGETGWQKNAISENMNRIYNLLTDMFNEKTSWLADLSKITDCDMTPWDVYSDDYFIDLGHGIELDIFNANITAFFEDLLNTLFERYEDHENQDLASEMLDLRDTLYHYLAVA